MVNGAMAMSASFMTNIRSRSAQKAIQETLLFSWSLMNVFVCHALQISSYKRMAKNYLMTSGRMPSKYHPILKGMRTSGTLQAESINSSLRVKRLLMHTNLLSRRPKEPLRLNVRIYCREEFFGRSIFAAIQVKKKVTTKRTKNQPRGEATQMNNKEDKKSWVKCSNTSNQILVIEGKGSERNG